MAVHDSAKAQQSRAADLDMSADEFRAAGHALIDEIASFFESIREQPVTTAKTAHEIRQLIGTSGLPEQGESARDLLREVAPMLFQHSLHNGHPRFLGYITSSAAPIGVLADLLAAAVNSNLAKWDLSPLASEIESQTIRWIAEFIGYPVGCGGLLVSGGNAANFLGFVAARKALTDWDIRQDGLYGDPRRLTAYVSQDTHTWIDKAADVCGLGAVGIRWLETDSQQRLSVAALRRQIEADRREGRLPFFVVATAGSVGTGAIDPLRKLAAVCREEGLWLHVDGAYGAPAASLPEAPPDLRALALADSVALDPHKWLYSPLEAACVLTRDPRALPNALSFRPDYYSFDAESSAGIDYYEHGMQNSRAFRALKVWLGLRQAGGSGYRASIREDIDVARHLFNTAQAYPQIEARTLNLSIATFRYVPRAVDGATKAGRDYLNELNKAVLGEIQRGGELFLSNAVIEGEYFLRACCVNFRTVKADVEPIPAMVADVGQRLDRQLRPNIG